MVSGVIFIIDNDGEVMQPAAFSTLLFPTRRNTLIWHRSSGMQERQGGLTHLAKLGNVERRRERNKSLRSAVKTSLTKAEKLISKKEAEAISAEVIRVISTLDKAAKKGVIHPNQAARRKSRLMKKLNRAKQS